MRLIVAPGALKAMDPKAMPRADRDALIAKAEAFALEPFGRHGWASRLKGMSDRVRIRQGDWRAVLLIVRERDTVVLEQIGNRKEVYR
jgi:mRNA interferase RelE/StbE